MQKELVYKQDAIDAVACDITISGLQNAKTVAAALDTISNRVKALSLAEPEITMEEVREFCRKRCLTVITNDFYNSLTSAHPEQETYSFTRAELEAHDQQVRQDFAAECCKALSGKKGKEKQPDIRERIAGITLLSLDEYRKYWKNIKQINVWWWLRSPGYTTSRAACVLPNSHLSEYGCLVSAIDPTVRPALVLYGSHEIGQSISFGGKTWTTISDSLALADEPLRDIPFRRDWKAPDASSYDKSDIRQYLNKWLAEAMEREDK